MQLIVKRNRNRNNRDAGLGGNQCGTGLEVTELAVLGSGAFRENQCILTVLQAEFDFLQGGQVACAAVMAIGTGVGGKPIIKNGRVRYRKSSSQRRKLKARRALHL